MRQFLISIVLTLIVFGVCAGIVWLADNDFSVCSHVDPSIKKMMGK